MIFNLEESSCIAFIEDTIDKDNALRLFRKQYNKVRAYHATRLSPQEVEEIKLNGLMLPTVEFLKRKALKRFVSMCDSEEVKRDILKALADILNENTFLERMIFFALNKESLFKDTQYLLFGSEQLLNISNTLLPTSNISFRHRLFEFGHPCIVVTDIPTSILEDDEIKCIFDFYDGAEECCVVVRQDIPSGQIIDVDEVKQYIPSNGISLY